MVLSFGLTNVPAIFQRYINQILKEEIDQEGISYMDDILVVMKTRKEHRSKVRQVLTVLLKTGLRMKQFKCEFEERDYLPGISHRTRRKLSDQEEIANSSGMKDINENQGSIDPLRIYQFLSEIRSKDCRENRVFDTIDSKGSKTEMERKGTKGFQGHEN